MKFKILLWDLETSHNIVASFGLYKQNIPYQNILHERSIICASYKYLGENKIHSLAIDPNHPHDDYKIVKELHRVISSADGIVAHYGDKFDMPFYKARMIYHGLNPLPPIMQIDTHKMAKKSFLFNCNRLDYIGAYLGIGRKIETKTGLWLKCLNGDEKAIRSMVRYNRGDIRLLEAVYNRLAPHSVIKLNYNIDNDGNSVCPYCGSDKYEKRGYAYTKVNQYQRIRCLNCGKWGRMTSADKSSRAYVT